MAFYGKVDYWNERYEATAHLTPCEWYRNYSQLRHLLNPASLSGALSMVKSQSSTSSMDTMDKVSDTVPFPDRSACRVLILGCGNSTLGMDMVQDGWTGGILNLDFSASVIGQLRHVYQHVATGTLDFVCVDVTEPLTFLPSGSFDLIVCKGTLDAVLCQSRAKAGGLIRECVRLLAPGHGVLALVTSGNPDSRLEYLEHENELSYYWRGVSVHTLKNEANGTPSPSNGGNNQAVYCYICRKRFTETETTTGKENQSAVQNSENVPNQAPMAFGQAYAM